MTKPRTVLHWDADIRGAFIDLSQHISEVVYLIEAKNYEQGITENMVCETLRDWIREDIKVIKRK